MTALFNFLRDPDGAITVDWVVLVAVVIGLALPVVALIGGQGNAVATEVSDHLAAIPVEEPF